MDLVEAGHLALDIVLAATLSAWLLAFATDAGTDRATAAMAGRSARVRLAALALGVGLMARVVSLPARLTGDVGQAYLLDLLAYPLLVGGAIGLASATWRPRPEAAA